MYTIKVVQPMQVQQALLYKLCRQPKISDFNQTNVFDEFHNSEQDRGSFAEVYKVLRIEDNRYYALKQIKINYLSQREQQNALNEVRILASMIHPNIIAYKEAFIDNNTKTLNIVLELADQGDLQSRIQYMLKNQLSFTEIEVKKMAHQLFSALRALHDQNICHRDIKSGNIFLMATGDVKLGDMNVSKVSKQQFMLTQTGTPYYASPEVWKDQPYDNKSDIWSLGCVLYEMVKLRPPFMAADNEALFAKISKGLFSAIPPHYSYELTMLIRMLLQVVPLLRPSAQCVLQMSYFEDFHQKNQNLNNKLLKTIFLDKKTLKINLPKSRYQTNESSPVRIQPRQYQHSPMKYSNRLSVDSMERETYAKKRQMSQIDIPRSYCQNSIGLPQISRRPLRLII